MSKPMLVDFAILCGCDFCPKIRNIGPQTAYDLIRKYKNLERILQNLDRTKYDVPPEFSRQYKEARNIFLRPNVIPGNCCVLDWSKPDITGLKARLRNILTESELDHGIKSLMKPFMPKKKKSKAKKVILRFLAISVICIAYYNPLPNGANELSENLGSV